MFSWLTQLIKFNNDQDEPDEPDEPNELSDEINIEILLDDTTTKFDAANNLINLYNLQLTTQEILDAFKASRQDILLYPTKEKFTFIFNNLLNTNINMFVALIKSTANDDEPNLFVSSNQPYTVGYYYEYYNSNKHRHVVNAYKKLLNYYDFSVDDLTIPDKCKLKINKYRNKKYGGNLCKLANYDV